MVMLFFFQVVKRDAADISYSDLCVCKKKKKKIKKKKEMCLSKYSDVRINCFPL